MSNIVNLTIKVSSREHENLNQAYDPYSLAATKTFSPKIVISSETHFKRLNIP